MDVTFFGSVYNIEKKETGGGTPVVNFSLGERQYVNGDSGQMFTYVNAYSSQTMKTMEKLLEMTRNGQCKRAPKVLVTGTLQVSMTGTSEDNRFKKFAAYVAKGGNLAVTAFRIQVLDWGTDGYAGNGGGATPSDPLGPETESEMGDIPNEEEIPF